MRFKQVHERYKGLIKPTFSAIWKLLLEQHKKTVHNFISCSPHIKNYIRREMSSFYTHSRLSSFLRTFRLTVERVDAKNTHKKECPKWTREEGRDSTTHEHKSQSKCESRHIKINCLLLKIKNYMTCVLPVFVSHDWQEAESVHDFFESLLGLLHISLTHTI